VCSWDAQQEQFAKFVLFELCGLYEAWLEDVVPRSVSGNVDSIVKALQFPTKPGKQRSFQKALRAVNANRSNVMKAEFFPVLKAHRKNSWNNIEDLLKAYRYFKEIRNAIIHFGGIADVRVVEAYKDLSTVPPANLGLTEALTLRALSVGDKVTVGFKNVVGFSNIVHRLIVTMDAMLAVSKLAEKDLVDRFPHANKNPHALSKVDAQKRNRRLLNMLSKAHIPRPIRTTQLEALLVSQKVIF
jgi:hypothetical protein